MNITSLICANARVQKVYIYEQREYKERYKYKQYKSTHEFAERKLERLTRGSGRMWLWAVS